jgi:heme-degrading monooxygenase HmoA
VPDLPWTARAEFEPGSEYFVMASYLPLQKLSSTVRFFRAVSAVRKQLADTHGLVGYTLRAKVLGHNYWTLSVWEDESSLRRFMRTPPHLHVMTSLKPFMGATKFVTWNVAADDGRPGWKTAIDRLATGG